MPSLKKLKTSLAEASNSPFIFPPSFQIDMAIGKAIADRRAFSALRDHNGLAYPQPIKVNWSK